MNVERNRDTNSQASGPKFDPDTGFREAIGWLAALSIAIAALASLT